MNFSLSIEYPWRFILLCMAAGLLYAFVLYRKEKRFDESPQWVKFLLPVLRFLAVAFLAFFLLSPFIKNITRTIEKPIIIFAQDNSESIVVGKDSAYYKKEYAGEVVNVLSKLSEDFDTNNYSFGNQISRGLSFSYKEKQTDMATLFQEIDNRFINRNIGAVIIASDGLYNKVQNPIYSLKNNFPVYTIALGDTTVQKDLILTNVLHNKIVYLGNKFPISIQIEAARLSGKNFTCTISKGAEKLFSQQVNINSNNFSFEIQTLLEAKQKGIQRYTIALSRIDGEITYANNVKDVFVDVVDGKQKILILADAPHPDIAAIKNALEANLNYEVNSMLASDFNASLSGYNMVVLHQLPSLRNPIQKIITDIEKQTIPVLFVLGSQSSVPAFNKAQSDLTITSNNGGTNNTLPLVDNDFSLFTTSDEMKSYINKLPPLQSPFGSYKMNPSASVFCYQKIGVVETRQPLLFFTQQSEKKTGFICGEGIWRWRLQDVFDHTNTLLFNELITKTAQYLSAAVDKSFFRVNGKNNFYENELIEFDAELYNESYELINNPEVNMMITNGEGKKFPYVFSKTSNGYHLNAGRLPVDHYHYEAKTQTGKKIYSLKGEFSVSALQVESSNIVADHQLLYSIAKKSGGEMLDKNNLSQLIDILSKRDDIHSVSHSEKKLSDMINLKWIFFLLLLLISTEWLVRKINGSH